MLVSRFRHIQLLHLAHYLFSPPCLIAQRTLFGQPDTLHPPPLLIVQPRHRTDLEEAVKLLQARYADVRDPDVLTVGKRQRPGRPGAAYFGTGVISAIKQQLDLLQQRHDSGDVGPALDTSDTDSTSDLELEDEEQAHAGPSGRSGSSWPLAPVYVNETLHPIQELNLSAALGRPVIDRVGLIIDIFAQRAHTREAKLQVELASLAHQKARLIRMSEQGPGPGSGARLQVVSARQRGRSGAGSLGGGGGSGDAEVQMQRYRILRRVKLIRKELKAVTDAREVQRRGRQSAGVPQVAVVGYTNVGKSSLVNRLCGCALRSEDALFVTLDPVTRRVLLPSGDACVLSDTVGFISELPVQLVEAFKATLEEVAKADLILHVLDASSPHVKQQRTAVLKVLLDLGLPTHKLQTRMIEVWNKCDLLSREDSAAAAADDAQLGWAYSSAADRALGVRRRRRRICIRSCMTHFVRVYFRRGGGAQRAHVELPAAATLREEPGRQPAVLASRRRLFSDEEPVPVGLNADPTTPAQQPMQLADGDSNLQHGGSGPDADVSTSVQVPAQGHLLLSAPVLDVKAECSQPEGSGLVNEDDQEAEAGRRILERVKALVLDAHDTTFERRAVTFKPLVVATSMSEGWGYDSLLRVLEDKLASCGLLRGVGRRA